jgi:hypothetical protein
VGGGGLRRIVLGGGEGGEGISRLGGASLTGVSSVKSINSSASLFLSVPLSPCIVGFDLTCVPSVVVSLFNDCTGGTFADAACDLFVADT